MEEHFLCNRCGLCCQSLKLNDVYRDLDRGDGVCKYYGEDTHECSIYSERPLLCNIDVYYDAYCLGKMTRQEFYELNYDVCRKLKAKNV